ncbi:MAG: hypothetical protein AB7S26_11760 [Sandaracinaceae bacterium]
MARIARALVVLLSVGCAFGDGRTRDAGPGGIDAGRAVMDASATHDAGRDAGTATHDAGRDAGASMSDAGRADASTRDAGTDGGPPGGALDPRLSPADPSGAPCSDPGSLSACPGIEVCRFYSATEGRCESCGPCGNLNAFCASSAECDILFMCFSGRCTNFCTLGTYECGAITDCIDIGHPTRGVCRPF